MTTDTPHAAKMQANIEAADKTLLTQQEQFTAAQELLKLTGEQSQMIRDVNTALGEGMLKELADAQTAHHNLTTAINTEGLDAMSRLFSNSHDAADAMADFTAAALEAIRRLAGGSGAGNGNGMAQSLQAAGVSVP